MLKVFVTPDSTKIEYKCSEGLTGPVTNVSLIGLINHKGFAKILTTNSPPIQKEIKSFIFWMLLKKKPGKQYYFEL